MTADAKAVALGHLGDYVERFTPEFVIADGDLVTVAVIELRGSDNHELTTYHTFRILDGEVVEHWSSAAVGSAPPGSGRPDPTHVPLPLGQGDPTENKRKVADFFRCVLESHNADAAKDFVTEGYIQHARHVLPGRSGLEDFVRSTFPGGPIETPKQMSNPPVILMAEGDRVVIAGGIPQPDGQGGMYTRYLYDGFRLEDGLLAEHWSGIDPDNRPILPEL